MKKLKKIVIPLALICILAITKNSLSMEEKQQWPKLPKDPESYLYIPEEERHEVPHELAGLSPDIAELIAGVEDISLLEGPEKKYEVNEPVPFQPFESLKPQGLSRIMTSKNVRPSKAHGEGFPELWYEDENLSNVEEAIKAGAPINGTHPINPLRYAVLSGNIPLINLLLKYGAKPDVMDMSGFTAISAVNYNYQPKKGKPSKEEILELLNTPFKSKANL